jgi:predicted enzyme related to lactoylglutathione lyase
MRMSERSEYAAGEFCWVDLSTTDVEAAKRFYGELLGADAEPAPGFPEEDGGYGYFTKDGKRVAGFGPSQQEGQPSFWLSYVKVEDTDETTARMKEAGGKLHFGPVDLPGGSGRIAVFQDPTGAVIAISEEREHKGAQLVNEPGSWTWNNLLTRDVEAAREFYGKVFGWTPTRGEGVPDYIWNWQMEGQRWPEGIAGLMAMGSEMPAEAPPYWQVYFAVDDLDAAIEKTKGDGGRLIFGPQDTPVARIAVLFDPQGASFSLIEPDYPEPR